MNSNYSPFSVDDIERIETVLYECRAALKILHPEMDKEEPCFIYETYMKAGKLLIELETISVNIIEEGNHINENT